MQFENKKIEWLEYDLLGNHPILLARTYLRHGGVSQNKFFSLNASNQVGDKPDNVKINRQAIENSLEGAKLVFANQTHSDEVVEVTQDNLDKVLNCDGLVTKAKNIALIITHADCQAALFFDPEYEVIAAVHAGWRGLVKNIYQRTLDFMKERFNSRKENILVCISPSICDKHFEFKDYKKEFPKDFWSYQKEEKPFHFDLNQIAIDQLKKEGIQENNIEVADDCTFCDEDNYFSFRRSKETGRHATAICLKE